MIPRRIWRGLPGALASLLLAGAGWADTTVRSGNHPDFGRVVIDVDATAGYQLDQTGDHVTVRLPAGVTLGRPPPTPKNVAGLKTDGAAIELTLKPGTHLHPSRINGRLVLDIFAGNTPPPKSSGASSTARPIETKVVETKANQTREKDPARVAAPKPNAAPAAASPAERSKPEMAASPDHDVALDRGIGSTVGPPAAAPAPAEAPVKTMVLPPPPTERAPVQPPPSSVPVPLLEVRKAGQQMPPGRDVLPENDGPIGLRATRVKPPKGLDAPTILLPFGPTTAAAAFRRREGTYIVFDERRAVDMAGLRDDPAFGSASVRLLAKGTLLLVPHAPEKSVMLSPTSQGWRVTSLDTAPRIQPIVAIQGDGRFNLLADEPGEVVSLTDPATGATLLAGTQRRPGQGTAYKRGSVEFIMWPTSQGVLVETVSDTIDLKQAPNGFNLTGLRLLPPPGTADVLMDAARLTRRLQFSPLSTEALLQQTIQQINVVAATPPGARGPPRRAAAETMLALGLGAEAHGLLRVTTELDPKVAAMPETGAYMAIAALMAGRPAESDALLDQRLDGSDDITFWRAVREAMLDEGSPRAAAAFGATAPLVFRYPVAIRDHVLPLVVETMIQGGEITTAERILNQRKDDPRLAYARALMRQAEGATPVALEQFDALAHGRDQFDRVRAAIHAVELRLAGNTLDKQAAADALEKLLYAWRGDARELAVRQRIAELRGETGAWRLALSTLRLAEADFPEKAAAIHTRLKDTFADMIRGQNMQQVPPIIFVTTVDENAELLPDDDEEVQQALAERLLALELPGRAKPLLEKLMRAAKADAPKARFGASLASLNAREGDDTAALTALNSSEGPDLPPPLAEQRLILRAETTARLGDPVTAAAMLTSNHTFPATEARAQILERAASWVAAEQAWAECVALSVPDAGPLNEMQTKTILRLATAATRAGDDAALAGLREKYLPRLGGGPLPDMFRLLTAEPIRTSADIGRSRQDMNIMTSLPADFKALRLSSAVR